MRELRFILGAIGVLILICPTPSLSQVTYRIDTSAAYSYVSGANSITSWVGDKDDGYFDLPLGDFVFQFYSVPVTSLRVSTNGYMTFGTEGQEYYNYPIPYSTPPNALIAPFWADLTLSASGLVRWDIFGTYPSRQLVVEWFEVPSYTFPTQTYSFEAILYESTNQIKFQYSSVASGIPYSVGVENFDGTSGSQFSYNNTPPLSSGLAVEFIPELTTLFFDDFSTDKGWAGYDVGGWERGPAVAGGGEKGNPDPGMDHSLSSDNYILGFAIGGDYSNNLVGEKAIVSPPINCVGKNQIYLKFWRYLNVGGNVYDHAKVYVSNDKTNWTQLWENPVFNVTDNQWTQVVHDISSVAANQATVYIKFTIGPTDSASRFSGWNIDDLEVTSSYSGAMALYVPSGNSPNPNIEEMLIQAGLGIKHSNGIPSDLSDYGLLIVGEDEVCNSTTANYIKNFLQGGGGAIIMGGTPSYLASSGGPITDLSSISDWFGAGTYGNDCGYATVIISNPFATDLLITDKLDYAPANTCLAPSVYDLDVSSTGISAWSGGGTHSFVHRYSQGGVFYYAGNPGYSEDPDPVIVENGLILFEAGLMWAMGCIVPMVADQPQSQTIQSGQTASISVSASGTTPFTYQWYQGSSGDTSNPMSAATSSDYTTPALTQTTSYWVKVTNPCGFVNSDTAIITVSASCTTPNIISQPQSQTIQSGQTASISVSASGTTPFSYQWYQGSSGDISNPISGATSSSYTTPALTQTVSYWVKVSNSCGYAYSDTAIITVNGNTGISINVVSPNGGDSWPAGSTQSIQWTYTGNPGSYVKIELLKGGVVDQVIKSSTPKGRGGSGSRKWTIPVDLAPGTDYRIRVTSTSNGACADTSDSDFAIVPPTITVASPNGGETWSAGSKQTIRWSYTGNPGSYVKVELMKGGTAIRTISSSASKGRGGSGSRSWTVPADLAPGTDYRIRVTSTSNGAYTDTSDSDFTIQ